jgi:hypothetical protein
LGAAKEQLPAQYDNEQRGLNEWVLLPHDCDVNPAALPTIGIVG